MDISLEKFLRAPLDNSYVCLCVRVIHFIYLFICLIAIVTDRRQLDSQRKRDHLQGATSVCGAFAFLFVCVTRQTFCLINAPWRANLLAIVQVAAN